MSSVFKVRLKIEEYLTVVLLGALVLLVFLAAALRWVGISIVWSVDLAQFLLTWLCFIGADIAYGKSKHMGVDLLKNLLPDKMRTGLNIVIDILFVIFMCSILYFGAFLSVDNYARKFNALPISYSFATLSAPVGAGLMIFTGLEKIIRNIRYLCGKGEAMAQTEDAGGSI